MRIGLVNPYSLDVPGGVQAHVVDLADYLIGAGHHVSMLTPAEPDTQLPPYAVNAGSAVPVPYNGSVARLAFGPGVAARVREWVAAGRFDLVHIHEPASPSVSLLALWAASGPIVATFHSAQHRSRSLRLAGPLLQPAMDKISGRIAVSEQAHDTVLRQLGGRCVVIPNGVDTERFACVRERGRPDAADQAPSPTPTVVFLGRFSEPRKGLPVLLRAMPRVLESCPEARLVVAGPGDPDELSAQLPAPVAARCEFTGALTQTEKVALLGRADVYVAPNTGGESFGIILIEAMAAGAPVVAADLPAFREVLQAGRFGELFPVEDATALGDTLTRLLRQPHRRAELAGLGPQRAMRYDWSRVGRQVVAVYDSVRPPGSRVYQQPRPLRRASEGQVGRESRGQARA
ncbi:MAG: glycosyltransferase family 4 protein [Ornithinimicrobium sp.]